MNTNEAIAERAAEKYLTNVRCKSESSVRELKQDILAAIHEAATPQWSEADAVDWPTEPGLWLACRESVVVLCDAWGVMPNVSVIGKGSSNAGVLHKGNGWRFCGPIEIPLPSPPAPPAGPDPWDYAPQDGDSVWVSFHGQNLGCYAMRRDREFLRVDGFMRGDFDSPDWKVLKGRGYRFAKASCSPPPAIGGDS